ncbi:MAG TPA: glycosyltransferase family 4 protein [Aliidongia sp.]|nr:glycosyltransferase family 4 protein [Aliidongia sp.]
MTDGKILLIANNFPPVRGGSAVVYDNLARNAADRIVVLAPKINYIDGLPIIGWREHDRRAEYRVVRLPLLRTTIRTEDQSGLAKLWFLAVDLWLRLHLVTAVLRLIREEKITAVCIGELLASGWLLPILRLLSRVRLLVYVHGEEITTEDLYDPGARRRRSVLSNAHQIIVVSRFTRKAVRDLIGPAADAKTTLIENGVNSARFRCHQRRQDLVELYRLTGSFVFVSVCRLLEKKGIDNAIRAFAQIAPDHPDCRYLIVGAGPFQQRLQEIAAEAGVKDKVIFTNQVPDHELVDHYCLGDVFVMPNRELPNGDTEGFGLVFLEANSCGLPVIAGRDGGSTDAVRHGENGLVVNGASIDEIAAAMISLRQDTGLRQAISTRGLAIAASSDWKEKIAVFVRLCLGDPASA